MFLNNILDISWLKADDASVWDIQGKKYTDFTCGIFATNIGHANEYVTDAIRKFAELPHTYTFQVPVREKYIYELCKFTGFEDAALFSAGTEATEAAWKIARLKTGNWGVWGLHDAFHGKTMGAMIMAGTANSPHYAQTRDKTSLIIMEPYTAHTASFHSEKTITRLRGHQNDGMYLCVDEIQAGFGRTGKLFGYQHYDYLDPDFVCIGKGMGNGFPISGILGPKELISEPFFDLSSTHGGNPLACAVGLAVIDYFRDYKVLDQAEKKGVILQEFLKELPILTAGKGMVAGLWLDSHIRANQLVRLCADNGLLVVHTGRQTVKIAPPLTITKNQMKEGCDILKHCVEKVMENEA